MLHIVLSGDSLRDLWNVCMYAFYTHTHACTPVYYYYYYYYYYYWHPI